jgi:DNA-binding response OmpR family regulator
MEGKTAAMEGSPKKTILVADDDRHICQIIAESLALRGLNAVCVHNGLEVLSAVRTRKPDLVILDILMPGRDGFGVLREIKSDPSLAHIPVIMFTQIDQQQDRLVGLELGAIDFIPKPFLVDSLLNKIEFILSRS